MKNVYWKCKIFDHKAHEVTDSGYAICKRCGAHEYYDEDKWVYSYSALGILKYIILTPKRICNTLTIKIKSIFIKDSLPF